MSSAGSSLPVGIVCKNCGKAVSPYASSCPGCGTARLQTTPVHSLSIGLRRDHHPIPKLMAYYISRSGQQFGPYERAQLQEFVAQGRFVSSDFVWNEGTVSWVPLADIFALPHLRPLLQKSKRIKVTIQAPDDRLVWPPLCVCCCNPKEVVRKLVVSRTERATFGGREVRTLSWQVPYCRACILHEDMGGLSVLAYGSTMFLAMVLWISAAVCLLLMAGDLFNGRSWRSASPMTLAVLICGGIAVKWLSKELYIRLSTAQLKHVRPDCSVERTVAKTEAESEFKAAVLGAGRIGIAHSFTFTNSRYADIFQRANIHG